MLLRDGLPMPALHRSLIQSLPVFSAMDTAELDEVIGHATALRIPKGERPRWDDYMARHPAFARNVMQMMGQRIEDAHTRLKEMSTQNVEHRVAHTVLRLVTQSGRKVEEGVLVDFRITRQGNRRRFRHDFAFREPGAERLGECGPRCGRPPKGHRLRHRAARPYRRKRAPRWRAGAD